MMAYSHVFQKKSLFYWKKETRTSQAEIDYIIQIKNNIISIEAKSGAIGRLKSLREYLNMHPHTPHAIRFSSHNYSKYDAIQSYPLYAIAQALEIEWLTE